jgi:hypothetical protein
MLWTIDPTLAATWTDEQLQVLKDERKKFAQEEQELVQKRKAVETDRELDKEVKIDLLRAFKEPIKEIQAMIKSATILVDYFYGQGRFANHCDVTDFPVELRTNFRILLAKL